MTRGRAKKKSATEETENTLFKDAEEVEACFQNVEDVLEELKDEGNDATNIEQERMVNERFGLLKNAYDAFVCNHNQYISCPSNIEGNRKAMVEALMKSKEDRMKELTTRVNNWLSNRQAVLTRSDAAQKSRGSDHEDHRSKAASDVTSRMAKLQVAKLEAKHEFECAMADLQRRGEELRRRYEQNDLHSKLAEVDLQCEMDVLSDADKFESKSRSQLPDHLLIQADSKLQTSAYIDDHVTVPKVHDVSDHTVRFSNVPESPRVRKGATDRGLVDAIRLIRDEARSQTVDVELPRPVLPIFNGDSSQYRLFIHIFETCIERRVSDDALRLTYLIQHCSGPAKNAIENFVLMDPITGYREARQTLFERFGRPHDIANSLITTLISGPVISPNDGSALMDLSTEMRKCELTMSGLGFASEIHNSSNILKIVNRLPNHLRFNWANSACDIIESGREPNFNDLYKFVYRAAKVSNTFYGRAVSKSTKSTRSVSQRNVYAVKFDESDSISEASYGSEVSEEKCPYCKQSHKLSDCSKFQKLNFAARKDFMFDNKRCFNCFQSGHTSRGCLHENRCTIKDCGRRHHKLFHTYPRKGNKSKGNEPASKNRSELPTTSANCNALNRVGKVCLRVLPVKLVGKNCTIVTNALLDCGSDVTLCSKELMKKLGCKGVDTQLQISTMHEKNKSCNVFQSKIHVKSCVNENSIDIDEVFGVEELLSLDDNVSDVSRVKDSMPHLHDVELPVVKDGNIGLLIGANVPEAFLVIEQRKGQRGEPYAIRTSLGWTLMGPINSLKSSSAKVNHISHDQHLSDQVKRFWETDFLDNGDDETLGMSKNDTTALDILNKGVSKVNNHYQLPLPFKHDPSELSNNLFMANKRLSSLKKRLIHDDALREKYTATVQEYIDKGWAKEVDVNVNSPAAQDLYFLPHHPVFHPRKPGKVRVVFDCAAQCRGTSLNDYLYTGPDLANSLLGVLLRFRKHSIALAADVEAMFHQVLVEPEHSKFMSFLWWPEGDLTADPKLYQMTVHIFGARSSPCCANYALKRTADDNAHRFSKLAVSSVHNNFYVDDLLVSVEDKDTAVKLRHDTCNLLRLGGFNLTKWCSNDRDTLESIPESLRASSLKSFNLEMDDLPTEGALGVWWNVEKDVVELSVKPQSKPISRRGILSVVSSVYDPLGVAVPFCLRAKVLLQDLCRRKISWDEELDPNDVISWNGWLDELNDLSDLWVPRCLIPNDFGEIVSKEIHHFCDASMSAYSAVSYLRLVNNKGDCCCKFILGKSRLAPIKAMTVPRLELSAAVLAVKLNNIISKQLALSPNNVVFWTDSTIVLQYIQNTSKRFQIFVTNRLQKINNGSNVDQWRHVGGKDNPADDGTRGLTVKEMNSTSRWLNGPPFLWQPEECWPKSVALSDLPTNEPELKRVKVCNIEVNSDVMINFMQRYSDLHKLLKATVWLLRYKDFLRKCNVSSSNINVDELESAKMFLIKYVQAVHFPCINENEQGTSSKLPRFMQKLQPIFCNGVLRVGGRMSNAPMSFDEKHPIILPSKCHLSDLIIRRFHTIHGHVGPSHTWSTIRRKYWIVNGGVEVRRVLSDCSICKRRNAKTGIQIMADLPLNRVNPNHPPFYSTGLDFFGPFMVKRGRSEVKRYGCIFTCLTSRAVHLEVAHGLDTTSFLNALSRFICRRGRPHSIHSDNGTNFVGGQRILLKTLKEWNTNQLTSFMQQHEIRWNYNPPGASHMGGVWERLIRSVRKILYNILLSQTVNDDSLHTIFVEVENILNCRPLVPLSKDPRDGEPITPNHLLNVSLNYNLPPGVFKETDIYSHNRWRQVQYVTDQFWDKWSKEYLPILQPRQKWVNPTKNLGLGDVVVVADNRFPKRCWPLGIVVQVYPDKKGHVRQVDVKTKDAVLRRPISKLCLLESKRIEEN